MPFQYKRKHKKLIFVGKNEIIKKLKKIILTNEYGDSWAVFCIRKNSIVIKPFSFFKVKIVKSARKILKFDEFSLIKDDF